MLLGTSNNSVEPGQTLPLQGSSCAGFALQLLHDEKAQRELQKTGSHPGLNWGPLT